MTTAEKIQSPALLGVLVAVAMQSLRDLGYALEPLVEREVRASGKDELAAEIQKALVELEADEAERLVRSYLEVNLGELELEADGDDAGQAPADPELADKMIVQVLSWPQMPGLRRHDLIIDPKQSVIGRMKYKKLSLRRAKELESQGRRFNKKYSNSPELG